MRSADSYRSICGSNETVMIGSLRNLITTWAAANVPNPVVRRDLIRSADAAEAKQLDCYFLIGAKLTRKRRAYLMHCYAKELFVFQLTSSQAKNLGVRPAAMSCTEGNPSQSVNPETADALSLDGLRLTDGVVVPAAAPIAGTCHYSATSQIAAPYALGLECALHGRARVMSWAYPAGRLEPEGTLSFAFASFGRLGQEESWHGTTALFFRVFSLPNPTTVEDRQPISNACAALVDVV